MNLQLAVVLTVLAGALHETVGEHHHHLPSGCFWADWSQSFHFPGWSTCGTTTSFMTELCRRAVRHGYFDSVSHINASRCCDVSDWSDNSGWSATQGIWTTSMLTPGWNVCPVGYFMSGLHTDHPGSVPNDLRQLDQVDCLRSNVVPPTYGTCTIVDVSFMGSTCVGCPEDTYMVGIYRAGAEYTLESITKIKCCAMQPVPCPPPCQQCTGAKCTVCEPDYFLYDDCCVQQCPRGYVGIGGRCLACPAHCDQCVNATTCAICKHHYLLYHGSCVATCPPGTTPNRQHTECLSCGPHCNQCVPNFYPPTCATCTAPFVLNGHNQCVCPAGTVPSGDTCVSTCSTHCHTCSSPTNCTICDEGYYLYNQQCVSTCPQGTYVNHGACQPCSIRNCSTCSNGINCTYCRPPNFLYEGMCITMCPNGFYRNYNTCLPCEPHCLECTSNGCTSCQSPYELNNGQCVLVCDPGTYYNGTMCVPCHSPCATCTSATNCTTCQGDDFLYHNQCMATCPNGTFANGTTCAECGPHCNLCTNATVCIQCQSPYELHDGVCTSTCPHGTYPSGDHCEPCLDNCEVCTSALDCEQCSGSHVLYNGTCVATCPLGTFNSSGTCEPCGPHCSMCYNATSCFECSGDFDLYDGQCLAGCPPGTYVQIICSVDPYHCESFCLPCGIEFCTECTPTACEVCQSPYVLSNGQCVLTCPAGEGPNAHGVCVPCDHPSCVLCPASYLHCIQCNETAYDNLLYNQTCVSMCPPGYFDQPEYSSSYAIDPYELVCLPCTLPHCVECSASPHDAYCVQCEPGYALYTSNPHVIPVCVPLPCPPGSGYDSVTQFCAICDEELQYCSNCTFRGHTFECDACYPPFELDNLGSTPMCVSECPAGSGNVDGICVPCQVQNCSICTNDTATCTLCLHGFALYNDTCVEVCPPGTFETIIGFVTRVCLPCLENCEVCDNDATCSRCNDDLLVFNCSSCIETCPYGYASWEGACFACDSLLSNCTTCTIQPHINLFDVFSCPIVDPFQSRCTWCVPPTIIQPNGTCAIGCPVGDFVNDTDQCAPCSAGCAHCSSSTNCTQCNLGRYLFENRCVSECPIGYGVPRYNTGECVPCPGANCSTCGFHPYGPPLVCLGCTPPEALQPISSITPCAIGCPTGYYEANVSFVGLVCYPCTPGCAQCTNSSYCSQCSNGTYAYAGGCYGQCPPGTGQTPLVDPPQCEPCGILDCMSCEIFGIVVYPNPGAICLICDEGYLLEDGGIHCTPNCTVRQFVNANNTCEACAPGCDVCFDAEHCVECRPGYVLIAPGICVSHCPANTGPILVFDPYTSVDVLVCEPCQLGCSNCSFYEFVSDNETIACDVKLCTDEQNIFSTCNVPLVCPAHSADDSGMQCIECPFDCLNCTTTGKSPCFFNSTTNTTICFPPPLNCTLYECDPTCLVCDPLSGNCLECPLGQVPVGTQCPFCDFIIPNCLQCTNATYCAQCPPNDIFNPIERYCSHCPTNSDNPSGLGTRCHECPPGSTSSVGESCANCTFPCETCFQYTTDCRSCQPNWSLVSNHCECDTPYFLINETECLSCDDFYPNCETCLRSGSYSDSSYDPEEPLICIHCNPGFQLNINGTCELVCLAPNIIFNGTCQTCDSLVPGGCQNCTFYEPLDEVICLDCGPHCVPGYCIQEACHLCEPGYLEQSSYNAPFLGQCVTTCPPTTIPVSYTQNGPATQCVGCPPLCQACTYEKKCIGVDDCTVTINNCTSCYGGGVLVHTAHNTSTCTCVDGHIFDPRTNMCTNVTSTCHCYQPENVRPPHCDSTNPLAICSSCPNGTAEIPETQTCVNECPPHTQNVFGLCVNSTCVCPGIVTPTDQTCNYTSPNALCSSCPRNGSAYYEGGCYPCDPNCETCQPLTRRLRGGATEIIGTYCVFCETNYWDSFGICEPCGDVCLQCTEQLGCVLCAPGYFAYEGLCIACMSPECTQCTAPLGYCEVCEEGFYVHDGECAPCPVDHPNCTAPVPPPISCPPGFYALNDTCYVCPPFCANCTNGTQCEICVLGNVLSPDRSYCGPCNVFLSDCQKCVNSTQCVQCDVGYEVYEGTCVSSCPDGTYQDGEDCLFCNYNCATCSGTATNCTSCSGEFMLDPFTHICVVSCMPAYYNCSTQNLTRDCAELVIGFLGDSVSGVVASYVTVTLSGAGFLTPDGPTEFQGWCSDLFDTITVGHSYSTLFISSMDPNLQFEIDEFDFKTNSLEIPNLSRISQVNYILNMSAYYVRPVSHGGKGLTFGDVQVAMWTLMFNGSGIVADPSAEPYSQVSIDWILSQAATFGVNYLPTTATDKYGIFCLTVGNWPPLVCGPTAIAQIIVIEVTVAEFPVLCTFVEQNDANCTSCFDPPLLDTRTHTCVASCPTGTYQNDRDCLACTTNCTTCVGSADYCISCTEPLLINIVNHTCVAACPPGTFPRGSECLPCLGNCTTCVDFFTCTSCFPGFDFYLGQCVFDCPNGTFLEGNNCLECPDNCDICSSGSNCTACTSPYLLDHGACAACRPGYYNCSGQNLPSGCAELVISYPADTIDGVVASYVTLTLTGAGFLTPSGPTVFQSWCADVFDVIYIGQLYSTRFISSMDANLQSKIDALDFKTNSVELPNLGRINEVNYILNMSDYYVRPVADGGKGLTFGDVQVSIWTLLFNASGVVTDPTALPYNENDIGAILSEAATFGANYRPLSVTDKYGVFCMSVNSWNPSVCGTTLLAQIMLIEVTVGQSPALCDQTLDCVP